MKYLIRGKRILTLQGIIEDTGILIEDGRIIEVGVTSEGEGFEVINLDRCTIIPGLIDMHIHGANGFDTMDANHQSIKGISRYLAENGVTSFLATTVTADLGKITRAIENIADFMKVKYVGAELLGSYLEGPYITEEYKGAHPEKYIREINLVEIEELIRKSKNTIKVVVIAPEKEKSIEAIKFLSKKGIRVSLGHTNATYNQAMEAIVNGSNIAVHIFNGMRGLHHREPGLIGAVLNNDSVYAELICDCVHVDIPVIQIVLRCKKPEDVILITDCMMAGGLSDDNYVLGEMKVIVKNGIARLETGSLAGSTLRLMDAIQNMVERVGVTFENAVKMATINPARALGIDRDKGSLDIGKRADVVGIDERFNVVFTMINGEVVFEGKEQYDV